MKKVLKFILCMAVWAITLGCLLFATVFTVILVEVFLFIALVYYKLIAPNQRYRGDIKYLMEEAAKSLGFPVYVVDVSVKNYIKTGEFYL